MSEEFNRYAEALVWTCRICGMGHGNEHGHACQPGELKKKIAALESELAACKLQSNNWAEACTKANEENKRMREALENIEKRSFADNLQYPQRPGAIARAALSPEKP